MLKMNVCQKFFRKIYIFSIITVNQAQCAQFETADYATDVGHVLFV